MNCQSFRRALAAGDPLDGAALAHLRECGSCLEASAAADPFNIFRSLGGEDLVPPGGVDSFVGSVMDQVHFRDAERRLSPSRRVPALVRWSMAAALALGLVSAALVYRSEPATVAPVATVVPVSQPSISRPVVENYENPNATIVELASADDLQVVMVFDDSLPADL
jgi:hypothetical protein